MSLKGALIIDLKASPIGPLKEPLIIDLKGTSIGPLQEPLYRSRKGTPKRSRAEGESALTVVQEVAVSVSLSAAVPRWQFGKRFRV